MGAFVENIDRLCWTDVENAELRPAAVEAVGRDADVGRRVDEAFPEVEVDGETVEVAAWRSRVEAGAGVGGVPGAVLVLRGGGPVQEVSGGSAAAAVEVCGSDVRLEESVVLRGGAVELSSESTRWEESVNMDNPPLPTTAAGGVNQHHRSRTRRTSCPRWLPTAPRRCCLCHTCCRPSAGG